MRFALTDMGAMMALCDPGGGEGGGRKHDLWRLFFADSAKKDWSLSLGGMGRFRGTPYPPREKKHTAVQHKLRVAGA